MGLSQKQLWQVAHYNPPSIGAISDALVSIKSSNYITMPFLENTP